MRQLFYLSILCFVPVFGFYAQENVTVEVNTTGRTATISNGIVSIDINNKGHVAKLVHNGQDVIESDKGGRFYFSYNDQDKYRELSPNLVRIEKHTDDYAEVVYSNTTGTLRIEQGFILRKGVSGVYCYVILKGTAREIKLREMRVVYRVSPTQFNYGYVTDRMQGELPSVEIMKEVNDKSIMDATYPLPDGTIYTKYDWANYIAEDSVHGIMSESKGVWAIPVSAEYINGGPMRQELMVHTTNKTPLVLQMLQGEHFGAAAQNYISGDEKMYGPFFVYVNEGDSHEAMVQDAKSQATLQKMQWPFEWLDNDLYPTQRTTVNGVINLPFNLSPDKIQVVLAEPGGDIYNQGKEYIFWSKTKADGSFSIPHVRPGNYSLYAYATEGEITETYTQDNISVSGSALNLGQIYWTPVKREYLLWQIGDNDRLSKGFNMSDVSRKYGLYEFPLANLRFDIETSKPENNWYYAQTKEGTWTVTFNCDTTYTGNASLTVSVAGATKNPELKVTVNSAKSVEWDFGNDAAIYRSAVQGGYHQVKTFTFPTRYLKKGLNNIRFQLKDVGSRGGLLYDCIKLEAGNIRVPVNTEVKEIPSSFALKCYPNPFKNHTTFVLKDIVTGENVNISIYNLKGKLVKTVFAGKIDAEHRDIVWENASVPSGTYIYSLKTTSGTYTGKLVKQ